jgi:hypothetical protein
MQLMTMPMMMRMVTIYRSMMMMTRMRITRRW